MLRLMSVAGNVTVGNFSCNLCRNKIARQFARKIAWCNIGLRTVHVPTNSKVFLPRFMIMQKM